MILRLHSLSVPIPPSHPSLAHSLPPSPPPCSGDTGVRDHQFFEDVNWQDLLREKAEFFIPQLQGDEDTSYFDSASSFLLLGSPYFSHFPFLACSVSFTIPFFASFSPLHLPPPSPQVGRTVIPMNLSVMMMKKMELMPTTILSSNRLPTSVRWVRGSHR